MKLIYTKDKHNNEILQDECGKHQVMMEWEKPYMETCIELLKPSGKVLEIGFGLGYSATKICEYDEVTEYNVIECSPVVWEKFETWKQDQQHKRPELKMNILKGRWQDIMDTLEIYDTVFFDDYTYETTIDSIQRFQTFCKEIILHHSKIGTRLSVYSTTNNFDIYKKMDFLNVEVHTFPISIPEYCNYARGDKMYIPVLEIINDTINFDSIDNMDVMHTINTIKTDVDKYYEKYRARNVKYVVIDNFIDNIDEYIKSITPLPNAFKHQGIYSKNKRAISNTNDGIKYMIQHHIQNIWGNITKWNTSKDIDNINGSIELLTSLDSTHIDTTEREGNYYGLLLLSKYSNNKTTFNVYNSIDGTRYKGEMKFRKNKEIFDVLKYDKTRWDVIDSIGYSFNRLILFNADLFTSFSHNFGTSLMNSNYIQTFCFSCM